MTQNPRILIVGTADTKTDELLFMKRCIEAEGARAAIMDVGVLGSPAFEPEITNAQVAEAAGTTLEALAQLGDENEAMTRMATGAVALALRMYRAGEVNGVLALGGTMGTDLALDVTAAMPLGMPKFIVTTVAYSHLIPPERLAPDLMMILWAGGLYGLNSICRSILSQAVGAVLGACRTAQPPTSDRPRVAIGSLGKSCLSYMVELKPALEARGYEPVVFHTSGMGGQAMECLIAQREFVAVFDFCMQEVSNMLNGSVVTAGPDRLTAAGRLGIPQLVAPGAGDMIDLQCWAPLPKAYADRQYHAHNRLLCSVGTTDEERRRLAREIAKRLGASIGPTAFLLPTRGLQAWDLPEQPMHLPAAHAALVAEFRSSIKAPVELHDLDLHINDPAFSAHALDIFDRWVAEGRIPRAANWAQQARN